MKKSFKNIIIVTVVNVVAMVLAILILSVLHLTIGMIVAKIDGNDVQLIDAVIFCLKTNTKLVFYAVRKFIRAELDAMEK